MCAPTHPRTHTHTPPRPQTRSELQGVGGKHDERSGPWPGPRPPSGWPSPRGTAAPGAARRPTPSPPREQARRMVPNLKENPSGNKLQDVLSKRREKFEKSLGLRLAKKCGACFFLNLFWVPPPQGWGGLVDVDQTPPSKRSVILFAWFF